MNSSWLGAVAIALLSFGLGACASVQRGEWKVLAADPAPDAGFLERPERLGAHELAPFERSWTSNEIDWRRFSKLYVAPVDTSHVLDTSLWDELNIRHSKVLSYDLERQAGELRERVEDAFRDDPQKHFVVLDDPTQIDDDTAVLELSLVELVPNKAVLGAIGLAAWGAPLEIGIPVATLTAFVARGSIAIEGDVRDAATGEPVAMFADRENGKMRVIDLRSLTWYGNAHETMDDWAAALVELANASGQREPNHSPFFTFMPW